MRIVRDSTGKRKRPIWPWEAVARAAILARKVHPSPSAITFATIPTLWAFLLCLPGDRLTRADGTPYTALEFGRGELVYAVAFTVLATAQWLGICEVLPARAYRAAILLLMTWWLFLGGSLLARDASSLFGWLVIGLLTPGIWCYLEASGQLQEEAGLTVLPTSAMAVPDLPAEPNAGD